MTRIGRHVWLVWLLGSSLVLLVIVSNLLAVVRGDMDPIALWRNDFTNFWAGGHFIARGDYAGLYDAKAFAAWQWARFGEFGPRFFSYPPTFFPLAQLLGGIPYKAALVGWLTGTGALFAFAARKVWPANGGPFWLAVLTPAALLNLTMGQTGFLLGAMWLGVFALVDRRPRLAGVLIAGFLMKPQVALLLPLLLLVTGRWQVFAWAAGATTCALAFILLGYGWAPWATFIAEAMPRQSAFIHIAGDYAGTHTASIFTAVEFVTASSAAAAAAHALVGICAIYVAVEAVRQRLAPAELALVAATATFLILPYAMSYDLVVPMLAAWRILCDERADGTTKALAALGFVGPQVTLLVHALTTAPVLPFMLAALLGAQWRMLRLSSADRVAPASEVAVRSA